MLLKINFLSQALQMQTNVTVILPSFTFAGAMKGDAESYLPGTRFQTLYLLHGGFGDDSDYVNFTNVIRYADDHKLAVIMPNGYNSQYRDAPVGPLSSNYWEFIADELPKVCATMFPISTEREDTFAAGLSMGAMGAMRLAALEGERFKTVLLMSGTAMDILDGDGGETGPLEGPINDVALRARAKASVRADSEIYVRAAANVAAGQVLPDLIMTVGSEDFTIDAVRASRDLLTTIGYTIDYSEVPGYGHEWDFWDLSLRRAFEEWLPIRHAVIPPA